MNIEFSLKAHIYLEGQGEIMDRNRIILKTFEYWRAKVKGGRLPSRADIMPGELRDLLPFLFVADVVMKPRLGSEITLRLAGTHIERNLGVDLTGCPAGGIAKHWQEFTIAQDLFDAAAKGCAIATTHQLRGLAPPDAVTLPLNGPAFLRYHRVVLPLAQDGHQVNRLLGALVTETQENIHTLWNAPYTFEVLNKRHYGPSSAADDGRTSTVSRAHRVPA